MPIKFFVLSLFIIPSTIPPQVAAIAKPRKNPVRVFGGLVRIKLSFGIFFSAFVLVLHKSENTIDIAIGISMYCMLYPP